MTSKFSVSFNELKGVGSSISFLKRRLVQLKDGMMVVPGTTVEKVVSCFEKFYGQAKSRKIPCDASIQNEDVSPGLSPADSSAYRSVIGLLLYLSRDRVDIIFSVKELASCMSSPTLSSLQKLRKLIGYLKGAGDLATKLAIPQHGCGLGRKRRKSTSSGIHFVNGSLAYCSSRTRRVISLPSAESELHAMISGCSDAIFIKRCLQFLVNGEVDQFQWTDNSAARQLVARQGVGRIRHLSGKILWIQSMVLSKELAVGQVPTEWNCSDIGTKALARRRLLMLLHQVGAMDPETLEAVGEEEFAEASHRPADHQGMAVVMGLEPVVVPTGAEALEVCSVSESISGSSETFWLWTLLAFMFVLWVVFAATAYVARRKLSTDLVQCWNQVADGDGHAGQLEQRTNQASARFDRFENQLDMLKDELKDEITEVSNFSSMNHDYCTGLHFAIVEKWWIC
eukprot:s153_g26.t1